MKNYIYVKHTQWSIEVYYTRAKTQQSALLKLMCLSHTPLHLNRIVADDMRELAHAEQVLYHDIPDYEG